MATSRFKTTNKIVHLAYIAMSQSCGRIHHEYEILNSPATVLEWWLTRDKWSHDLLACIGIKTSQLAIYKTLPQLSCHIEDVSFTAVVFRVCCFVFYAVTEVSWFGWVFTSSLNNSWVFPMFSLDMVFAEQLFDSSSIL